jgi:SAM-dependent methyltransferase/uncharacterized protein YbaR (Trm112 family)
MIDVETRKSWLETLCCPQCHGLLSESGSSFNCSRCDERYPIERGIPRMVSGEMRRALAGQRATEGVDERVAATARSFGYEWTHFPEMRAEWKRNFEDYFAPHTAESFQNKKILDAGCGTGRHSFYAAKNGADVWAVDLGQAVEVARKNNEDDQRVRVLQADLGRLPFRHEEFDFVYSIGVLHHLPDPESAFRNLIRYVKPGGWIHVYLYWQPEGQPVKRAMLAATTLLRKITTRIPHRLLYGLSYPAAATAFAALVWPYQFLSACGFKEAAERLPMKQYARYPFRVCVNDQFDRFSAPIEYRYTEREVRDWFERAELEAVVVRPNFGWCATGQKPLRS